MSFTALQSAAPFLLDRAQQLFGAQVPMTPSLEVDFAANGPILDSTSQPGRLVAYLAPSTAYDLNKGLFQLSHEVFHALAPFPGTVALMIEEAGAVWFSLYGHVYPWDQYLERSEEYLRGDPASANYFEALKLYFELNAVYPGALRYLRVSYPRLNDLDPAKIRALIPDVSPDLANRLCERRQMR